jgi:hypothetical protein
MYEQVINSRNTTGTSLLTVEETCTYSPHPTNAGWTRYTQDARIQSAVPLLNRKFESYSVENMESKSPKVHYNTYSSRSSRVLNRKGSPRVDSNHCTPQGWVFLEHHAFDHLATPVECSNHFPYQSQHIQTLLVGNIFTIIIILASGFEPLYPGWGRVLKAPAFGHLATPVLR